MVDIIIIAIVINTVLMLAIINIILFWVCLFRDISFHEGSSFRYG